MLTSLHDLQSYKPDADLQYRLLGTVPRTCCRDEADMTELPISAWLRDSCRSLTALLLRSAGKAAQTCSDAPLTRSGLRLAGVG